MGRNDDRQNEQQKYSNDSCGWRSDPCFSSHGNRLCWFSKDTLIQELSFSFTQASLKDTETLFNALEWRLATLRAHQSRAAATASSIPDVDSSAALPAVPHNEDSASSPKRRALPVESEELGDETKKKRSEWQNEWRDTNKLTQRRT